MMPERLKEIRDRAEGPMPGPWLADFDKREGGANQVITADGLLTICFISTGHGFEFSDTTFIAHARNDIPDLLDHIANEPDRVRAAVEAETEACAEILDTLRRRTTERRGHAQLREIAVLIRARKQDDVTENEGEIPPQKG